jgi:hypothetical protein
MRVRWEQIDPRFATKVGAHVALTRSEEASEQRQERTRTGARAIAAEAQPLGLGWSVFSFTVALLVVLLYLSVCFNLSGPASTMLLTLLPVGLVTSCTVPGRVARGETAAKRRPRGRIAPDSLLRDAFSAASSTRAERLYGDVILLLATPGAARRDARLRRDLLRQCNGLLADYFRIEAQRRRVARLMSDGAILEQAESERADLAARHAAEPDVIARRSLEESLGLCDERIASVRTLGPLLARLDAHEEVICQAFSLVQTALARVEAAPVALTPPDVAGLRQTLRRVTDQTRAVEEAVAEIAEL